MMKSSFIVIAALFGAKIIWNLMVPYLLAIRRVRYGSKAGISVAPAIEWVLLAIMVGLSWAGSFSRLLNPLAVSAFGAVTCLGSYLHFVIAGLVVGWIASRWRR
jgi:hypothetical protein